MKNVPKLRFKEFSGEWDTKKIGDFITSHKAGAPLKPSDFLQHGNFEVIPKKAISSGGLLKISDVEPIYCKESFFKSNKRSVISSDFLVTTLRDLVPSGPSIGYIVKFTNDKEYILAQGVYGIKINKNLANDFLIQYSNSDNYRVLMQTMMVGSTQVHIRNGDFFQTPIFVPSLLEQTKIADFLTAIDDRISQLSQKCDGLAQYKKGVMQKIFSQELRFKDEQGRAFPAWDAMELNRIGSTFNGLTGKSGDDFGDGESYITYKQIFSDRIVDIAKFSKVKVNEGEKQNKVKYGDIFFTISSETPEEVGFHSVLLSEIESVYLNSFCFGFRINSFDVVIPIFAYYMFGSAEFRREVIKLAQGSTRYNISKAAFMEIKVKMPSPPEQEKIAGFLSAVDEKISQAQAQRDTLKQYKQGLLQQMFV